MSNEDEKTERLELNKIRDVVSANQATLKMAPINGAQDTVDRPIPEELLKRATPTTDKMNAIVDISDSLLESMPAITGLQSEPFLTPRSRPTEDLDATVEMPQIVTDDPEEGIAFSATIDSSGRIQLPANYLTDSRIRPGRKMKVRIEFID